MTLTMSENGYKEIIVVICGSHTTSHDQFYCDCSHELLWTTVVYNRIIRVEMSNKKIEQYSELRSYLNHKFQIISILS